MNLLRWLSSIRRKPRSALPSAERRRHTRFADYRRVSLAAPHGDWTATLVDISTGGCQIRPERDIPSLESLQLLLKIGATSLHVPVQRVRVGTDLRSVGLRFGRMTARQLQLLAQYIATECWSPDLEPKRVPVVARFRERLFGRFVD